MSLEFEYKTEAVGYVPEDRVEEWAEILGLNAEKVDLYGLDGPDVFLGGDGDKIAMAVGESKEAEAEVVLAHELGHAAYSQAKGEQELDEDKINMDDDGKLIVSEQAEINDSLRLIESELYAGFFEQRLTSESAELVPLDPLDFRAYSDYVDIVQGEYDGHIRGKFVSKFESRADEFVNSFLSFNGSHHLPHILEELREMKDGIDTGKPHFNTEDPVELLYGTWIDRHQNEKDMFFEILDSYLEAPGSEEMVFKQRQNMTSKPVVSEEYREQTASSLTENVFSIIEDLETRVEARVDSENIQRPTKNHATPNPSHFSEVVKSGDLDEMETYFRYKAGCVAGRVLSRRGVSTDELMEYPDWVRSYAEFALDLSIEMSAANKSIVESVRSSDYVIPNTKEDYIEGLKWWLDGKEREP